MTFDQLVFAAIVGTFGAAITTLLGVWASRRFGLPGIARQLDSEQGQLIETLQGAVKELREQKDDLEERFLEEQRVRRGCQAAIAGVKRDLRNTELELLDLYRSTGQRPPKRLTAHASESDS